MNSTDKKIAEVRAALRLSNFSKNLPFLILSAKLPAGQAYYEFADGHIEIREIGENGDTAETIYVRTLEKDETENLLKEHGLL